MSYLVYTLADPRTGNVRYVGRTKLTAEAKQAQYRRIGMATGTRPLNRWLRELWMEREQVVLAVAHADLTLAEATVLEARLIHDTPGLLNVVHAGPGSLARAF